MLQTPAQLPLGPHTVNRFFGAFRTKSQRRHHLRRRSFNVGMARARTSHTTLVSSLPVKTNSPMVENSDDDFFLPIFPTGRNANVLRFAVMRSQKLQIAGRDWYRYWTQ